MAKKDKNTAPKHFEDQFDDEEVLFLFRKHPIVMRKGLIFGMLALLVGTLPSLVKPEYIYFFGGLLGGLLLGIIIFFLHGWLGITASLSLQTNGLFRSPKKVFFHRTVVDLTLAQIQMVNYQIAGFQETLLGFGTIMMQTYVGDLVIHDVHHPAEISKKILKILRDKGITTSTLPAFKGKIDDEDITEED